MVTGYSLVKLGTRLVSGQRLQFQIPAKEEDSSEQLYSRTYGWLWTAAGLTAFFASPEAQGQDFRVETLVA